MTKLRILTGAHAGVTISLSPGSHQIDHTDDADLQISDWTYQPVCLVVQNDGGVTVSPSSSSAASTASPVGQQLQPWQPVRFGQTALCIGPSELSWPSDIDLMGRLLGSPKASAGPTWAVGWRTGVFCVSALMAVGVWSFPRANSSKDSAAKSAVPTDFVSHSGLEVPLAQRVQTALNSEGVHGLDVGFVSGRLLIHGVVEDSNQKLKVQALVAQMIGEGGAVVKLAVAADSARAIADAAGGESIEVKHMGAGVFVLSGQTPDLVKLRARVRLVASDLTAYVKRVDIDVTESAKAPAPPHAAAVLLGNDFQYVESANGVRVFSSTQADSSPEDLERNLNRKP